MMVKEKSLIMLTKNFNKGNPIGENVVAIK